MKINEKGRSMIEMLGVLAIIGVLSVGGIAGYSKAMGKFRVNKTIDLISHTVANTRILFGSQRNYADLGTAWSSDVQEVAFNAKLFPDEAMTKTTTGTGASATSTVTFENAYAGGLALYSAGRLSIGDNKAFMIVLTKIPQSACIDLATQDWSASSGAGFVAMKVYGEDKTATQAQADMDAANAKTVLNDCTTTESANAAKAAVICASSGEPMSTIVATKACADANTNTLAFKFF